MSSPRIFRDFKTSPEIIRLAVMMYVRYPLSLRNVEDLLHERGTDITHETVRFWWNRFGTIFAAEIRRNRVQAMQHFQHRRWHLNEVFVKINGVKHYLWRAVDHEGEVLESFVTKRRDKKAALRFLRKSLRRHGVAETIVTDRLASYGAALKALGAIDNREVGRWLNNRAEDSHQPFRRRERAMLRFRRMRTEGVRSEFRRNSPQSTARSKTSSIGGSSVQPGAHSHFTSHLQGPSHRRADRLAPSLRGLIIARAGAFRDLSVHLTAPLRVCAREG
jgi:putative transposase